MNILPFLLILLFLNKGNLGEMTDLLKKIDFQSFAPILQMFGVDEKTLSFLSSDTFSELIDGKPSLKSILPLLTNFIKPKQSETSQSDEPPEKTESHYLSPIKTVASTEIETTLGLYFS